MVMSDPTRIDIVYEEKGTGKLVLAMTEHRKWDEDPEMANQFFAKARAYLVWIQSDDFRKEHPKTETKDIIIEIVCQHEPSEKIISLIGRMNEATAGKSEVKVRYRVIE